MCCGEEGRCKGLGDEKVLTCCVAVVNTVGVSIRDFCASNVAKLHKTKNESGFKFAQRNAYAGRDTVREQQHRSRCFRSLLSERA